MNSAQEHYDQFLAEHYTWMGGGLPQKVDENRRFFQSIPEINQASGMALDLGCGSGFQSLALASLGYRVVAIDTSASLIQELIEQSSDQAITGIVADLRDETSYSNQGPYDLVVCMGDTLVHLPSINDIDVLIRSIHSHVKCGGIVVLGFRDLTFELKGIDRAIPVRLDDDRLMATFLEYEPNHVVVNDMLFLRDDNDWKMQKSSYRKLRLSPERVIEQLESNGFHSIEHQTVRGFSTIIAMK